MQGLYFNFSVKDTIYYVHWFLILELYTWAGLCKHGPFYPERCLVLIESSPYSAGCCDPGIGTRWLVVIWFFFIDHFGVIWFLFPFFPFLLFEGPKLSFFTCYQWKKARNGGAFQLLEKFKCIRLHLFQKYD